jgi:cytochrome c-type biogenesis protein CcmH
MMPDTRIAPLLLAALLTGLLAALLLPGSAFSALTGEELERKVQEISEQLRCPTCQAISVRDSEAAFSRQIRDKVRLMIEEGKSDEEIYAYFVSSYGEWILRAPKKAGVGLLLWGLPILGIVVAGALIFWRLRRSTRAARAEPGPPPAALSEAERARIEKDLHRFERGY